MVPAEIRLHGQQFTVWHAPSLETKQQWENLSNIDPKQVPLTNTQAHRCYLWISNVRKEFHGTLNKTKSLFTQLALWGCT